MYGLILDFLAEEYFGNSVRSYFFFLAVLTIGLIAVKIIGILLTKHFRSSLYCLKHIGTSPSITKVIEVVYYVLSGEYDIYLDVHQHIHLCIKQLFDERGIAFAFPTQTLHVETFPVTAP